MQAFPDKRNQRSISPANVIVWGKETNVANSAESTRQVNHQGDQIENDPCVHLLCLAHASGETVLVKLTIAG